VSDPRGVAVFGSSEPSPGESAYETARELGYGLGKRGYVVVTGGYGGVMEASSRGASEAGGSTLGVLSDIFSDRSGNRYLSRRVGSSDLFERTAKLVQHSAAFFVLPGKAGTLAELTTLWALDRAGCLGRRPVILLGSGWQPLLTLLARQGMLDPAQAALNRVVETTDQGLDLLDELLCERGDG